MALDLDMIPVVILMFFRIWLPSMFYAMACYYIYRKLKEK